MKLFYVTVIGGGEQVDETFVHPLSLQLHMRAETTDEAAGMASLYAAGIMAQVGNLETDYSWPVLVHTMVDANGPAGIIPREVLDVIGAPAKYSLSTRDMKAILAEADDKKTRAVMEAIGEASAKDGLTLSTDQMKAMAQAAIAAAAKDLAAKKAADDAAQV